MPLEVSPSGGSSRKFVLTTFFDGNPQDGGGYGHKRSMLEVLRHLQDEQIRVVVICSTRAALNVVNATGLCGVLYHRSIVHRTVCRVLALNFVRRMLGRQMRRLSFILDTQLKKHKTDLVLFLGPDSRALELLSHNFVYSVWDLCHLDHPEFPEVGHFGEFERREYLYSSVLPRAVAVITDSNHGRHLIHQRYCLPLDRIYAAQFMVSDTYANFLPNPASQQFVMQKYGLRPPYIFYPAQFWPHKNHKYILEAVSLMAKTSAWVPQVVFCGSDKGVLSGIRSYARELGVDEDLVVCGFVEDEFLPYLYRGAMALVMPTYFGPTNIPPLEALALNVPVCYSDFPSFREQLGDQAYYINLENPMSLVDALTIIREKQPSANAISNLRCDKAGVIDEYVKMLRRIIGLYRAKIVGMAG